MDHRNRKAPRWWLPLEYCELRAVEPDGEKGSRIAGYAARWDVESQGLRFGREIIRPGAFTKTLQESDVVSYWNHNTDLPFGRLSERTLMLREDDRGLWFDTIVPESDPGPFALEAVRNRTVKGASFGFLPVSGKEKWSQNDGGVPLRELLEVELFDVSPTANPAYADTEAYVRSMLAADNLDFSLIGAALRNEGLTNLETRVLVEAMMGNRLPEPGLLTHSKAADFLDRERRRLDLEDLES
jgi:HK97 family phage prohead protease